MATTPAWAGEAIPFALRAIGNGLSGNQFVTELRQAGMGMRRQAALQIYAQARTLAAEYADEPTRNLNAVPTYGEAKAWPVRGQPGILQTVRLFYVERVTGRVVSRFYNVKTERGVTRQEAINRAISANVANALQYDQVLAGAAHTGTANLVQMDVA